MGVRGHGGLLGPSTGLWEGLEGGGGGVLRIHALTATAWKKLKSPWGGVSKLARFRHF
jgi:hypothetical protein